VPHQTNSRRSPRARPVAVPPSVPMMVAALNERSVELVTWVNNRPFKKPATPRPRPQYQRSPLTASETSKKSSPSDSNTNQPSPRSTRPRCAKVSVVLLRENICLLTSVRDAPGQSRWYLSQAGARAGQTDVIVLDLGLAPISDAGRAELFEILDDRHGNRSTIVSSQLPGRIN